MYSLIFPDVYWFSWFVVCNKINVFFYSIPGPPCQLAFMKGEKNTTKPVRKLFLFFYKTIHLWSSLCNLWPRFSPSQSQKRKRFCKDFVQNDKDLEMESLFQRTWINIGSENYECLGLILILFIFKQYWKTNSFSFITSLKL